MEKLCSAEFIVETMYCKSSGYMPLFVTGFNPFPTDYCISSTELLSDENLLVSQLGQYSF
jgi:hypothetical protein